MTEKTEKKQVKGRFRPGQSGNLSGRPRGARNRVTVLAERLMAADAESIVRAVIASAQAGDVGAAKLILDRVAPVQRDRVTFPLAKVTTAGDASRAMTDVIAAVSTGAISPSEAEAISRVIASFIAALEISAFEQRLSRLELRVAS